MKTLFLNPNASEATTATLRRFIARAGWPAKDWQVRRLEDAPQLIGSAEDNQRAEQALAARLPALAADADRLVLMSSLDTGHAIACEQLACPVFGFTRSVLGYRHAQGQRLQAVTFGQAVAPAYEEIFRAGPHAGVVESHTTLEAGPHAAVAGRERTFAAVRDTCERLAGTSPSPIFLVGVIGLEMAAELRSLGLPLIDPVADLMRWLQAH
jgi:Asp/Glu/hydantoin racemase